VSVPELNAGEQATLLRIARESLAAAASGRRYSLPEGLPARLSVVSGAFVTLRTRSSHQLRGCIGLVEATTPVAEVVAEMAEAASQHDPRFAPVRARELDDIAVEISVLSPPSPIEPDAVVIGRHGLIVELGGRRGLLLPQVPVEQSWDRTTFLAHTCLKARLPEDSWKDPSVRLLGFTADVFGEE
jgi:AmmeMemoRadiSam system protein A